MNNRGSILQIVLIIFLTMLSSLAILVASLTSETQNYHDVEKLMQQKNLELLLSRYYLEQVENDILLSDSTEIGDIEVKSDVDDMGDYYLIETRVIDDHDQYSFVFKITRQDVRIILFEYEEE